MSSAISFPPAIQKNAKSSEDSAALYDVASLLQDRKRMRVAIDQLAQHFAQANIEKVVGIESRGFIMGAALAEKLGVGFALLRQKAQPPADEANQDNAHHINTRFAVHADAIIPNERILLIDDLIASGGSVMHAINLIQRLNGHVAACGFVINLSNKGGMQRLNQLGLNTHALFTFDDA